MTGDKAVGWLSVWGTAFATIVFALCSLSRTLNVPPVIWTDWTNVAIPVMFASGLWAATAGPYKLIKLDRANRRSAASQRLEGLCQQLLMTIAEAKPAIGIQALAVHVWRVDSEHFTRMASYRVERRQDSAVTWVKGKGALGQCWATNLEIEADLTDLHASASAGQSAFEQVDPESRFNLTWAEYRNTRIYESVWVTPLRAKAGAFIGCLSIDSTAKGRHADFVAACHRPVTLGLVSLAEQVLREA